jgi:hypothetical protein
MLESRGWLLPRIELVWTDKQTTIKAALAFFRDSADMTGGRPHATEAIVWTIARQI